MSSTLVAFVLGAASVALGACGQASGSTDVPSKEASTAHAPSGAASTPAPSATSDPSPAASATASSAAASASSANADPPTKQGTIAPVAATASAASSAPSAEPTASASATAVASASATASATAAPALTVQSSALTESGFSVWMQSAKSYKVGQPGTVEVVLVPKGEFHCNDKYPYKVKLGTPPPGISYAQEIARDASVSPTRTSVRVAFTPSAAGDARISGKFSFSVCKADQCVIDSREVAATVKVE